MWVWHVGVPVFEVSGGSGADRTSLVELPSVLESDTFLK